MFLKICTVIKIISELGHLYSKCSCVNVTQSSETSKTLIISQLMNENVSVYFAQNDDSKQDVKETESSLSII